MTSYKKTEVALIQLDSAIAAYFSGSHIEAITLAGASEEIFGAICERRGIEKSIDKIANLPRMLKESLDIKARKVILNKARNCLKHANDESEDEFEIALEDSYFMIVRAVANAEFLGIQCTENIAKFKSMYTN